MSDQKNVATVFGVIAGVALVGVAIGLVARYKRPQVEEDVNEIIAKAKRTIENMTDAVENIKSSAVRN